MYLTSSTPTQVTWHFIDRATYNTLRQGIKALDLVDFVDLSNGKSPAHNRLSESTLKYIMMMNERIRYVIFGDSGIGSDGKPSQDDYLYKQLEQFLQETYETVTSFYEILPIDNKSFLVVVENGFLDFTTQSKDNLKEFILACLGYLDRFKCDPGQLNQLYLRLSFITGYHLLIKARASS